MMFLGTFPDNQVGDLALVGKDLRILVVASGGHGEPARVYGLDRQAFNGGKPQNPRGLLTWLGRCHRSRHCSRSTGLAERSCYCLRNRSRVGAAPAHDLVVAVTAQQGVMPWTSNRCWPDPPAVRAARTPIGELVMTTATAERDTRLDALLHIDRKIARVALASYGLDTGNDLSDTVC